MNSTLTTIRRILVALLVLAFVFPISTNADSYPRLANYYLNWDMTDEQAASLAKWDVVVISPQVLERNPDAIDVLRRHNPQIKVLAYVISQEMNYSVAPQQPADSLWKLIYNMAEANNWWLRSPGGQQVSQWPATWMINISSLAPRSGGMRYNEYLPGLVAQKILYPGSPWDGVFYDNLFHDVSWVNGGDIDVDGDHIRDSAAVMDDAWQEGVRTLLTRTRELAGGKIVIGNARHNDYTALLNGRLHENFPEYPRLSWAGAMREYVSNDIGYRPEIFIINKSSDKPFDAGDFSSMRFGLASSLMGEGYYSYDWGQSHNELWWYDEYDHFLGQPTSGARAVAASSTKFVPGIWRRDFQNGVAVLNATESAQKIQLGEDLEKLRGVQDPAFNNGTIIRTLNLDAGDGAVLIKRVSTVIGAPYVNGAFVRVFDGTGAVTRNGFFAYNDAAAGGAQIMQADINGGGQLETIVATQSRVTVYDQAGATIASWYPYGTAYSSGITFDAADLDGDGTMEIVTGTGRGGAPEVKVFSYRGTQIGTSFYAYAKSFRGGVNVAVCNLNNNGKKQIVTGAGYMGGPLVRVFEPDGRVLSGGFFAYEKTFRGGVYVACGDTNGDSMDEIITGAGYPGTSHVRLFDRNAKPVNSGFFAFGTDEKRGVRVFAADLDGDGTDEILAALP